MRTFHISFFVIRLVHSDKNKTKNFFFILFTYVTVDTECKSGVLSSSSV